MFEEYEQKQNKKLVSPKSVSFSLNIINTDSFIRFEWSKYKTEALKCFCAWLALMNAFDLWYKDVFLVDPVESRGCSKNTIAIIDWFIN